MPVPTDPFKATEGMRQFMSCAFCGKDIPSLYPFSMCPTCGQPIETAIPSKDPKMAKTLG